MKKVLAFILSLTLTAAVAIGGTVAYLQSQDSDVNVMTLGNVKIEQHEYQRVENDGVYDTATIDGVTSYVLEDFEQGKALYPIVGDPSISGTGAAGWDDTVVRMTQVDSYGSMQVFAGKNAVDKFVTVENTGKSDAYIRTLVAIEIGSADADLIGISHHFTWSKESLGVIEIEGNKYTVIEFTYNGADLGDGTWRHEGGILPAGDTSYPSLSQVYLKSAATNEDCEKLDGNGNGTLDILVLSQAIQVNGFDTAEAAFDAAFPIADVANWFNGIWADYNTDTWDGTSDTSWYNDTDTVFTLTTAEQLAGLAELANGGNKFSGKTIILDMDMDMDGRQWTPVKKFSGTLDGNGHVISNYFIDATTANGGFIDVLDWGTIKNLTLADIDATVGNVRFGVLARSINQSNIDNVLVKDVNITTTGSEAFVAGLFCQGTVNSNMEVNNCTVENLTVNAENGAMIIAGITDFVQKNGTEVEGTNIMENLHVKNFKVVANDTDGYCNIGGLVGQTQSVWQNPRFNNCSVSGLDVTATGTVNVGGFMCAPGSYTYAENCTVEGKIDVSGVTSADNHAGGFFGDYGWGDNVSKGDHMVTSCTADVDIITKYAAAGGFVGSGTNSEAKNKNITLTNCAALGTVTCAEGGTAAIGGFAGQTDRGIYVNCSAAQGPFIGNVLDGSTLVDDGNGTLTVTK